MENDTPKQYVGRETQFFSRYVDRLKRDREHFVEILQSFEEQRRETKAALAETEAASASEFNAVVMRAYTTQIEALTGLTESVRRSLAAYDDALSSLVALRNTVAEAKATIWGFPDIP